ncbi:MAG: phosphoenolpyruvate-utilizing N-terminal domain-containing protein, partial [bacterium]
MLKVKGISASRGIARGIVHIEELKVVDEIEENKIKDNKVEEEIKRLEQAVEKAKKELQEIKEKTEK